MILEPMICVSLICRVCSVDCSSYPAEGKVKVPMPSLVLCVSVILIASGERVVLAQLIIETRREVGAMPGEWNRLDEGSFGKRIGIKGSRH